jgi:phosphate transport system substrate-binding protein
MRDRLSRVICRAVTPTPLTRCTHGPVRKGTGECVNVEETKATRSGSERSGLRHTALRRDTVSAMSRPLLLTLLVLGSCHGGERRAVVQTRGSDTMVNLTQAWAEVFENHQGEVSVAVSGGGSGTGIEALIQGTIDIATSSRPLRDEEVRAAEAGTGKTPLAEVVGIDALSVFVHPANPLAGLTFEELACIYADGGRCEHWSDVRGTVVPGCSGNRIIRLSRQSNSGTAQYFREAVAGKDRELRLGSLDLNGSNETVRLVESTPCAIGYVGMGYLSKGVKTLCLSAHEPGPCVLPTAATAADNSYPSSRELFMVTLGPAQGATARFLDWIKTSQAREVLERNGYVTPRKTAP